MVAHERAIDIRRPDPAVGPDGHLDNNRESVHVLPEGGEVGGKAQRQHRKDLCGCIDRRGVLARMVIDRSPALDQGIDVRHGDEHADLAAAEVLGEGELVEVA